MRATGGGFKGLLTQARRAAQRRSQRLSTAHALLVMLQSGVETADILVARGVREGDLLSALKIVDEEPHSALEVAVERAHKIAAGLGEADPRPIHLLLAIVRDPRTAGHRCLERVGSGPAKLRDDVGAMLGVDRATRRKATSLSGGSQEPTAKAAPRVSEGPPTTRQPTPPRPRRNRRTAPSARRTASPTAESRRPRAAEPEPQPELPLLEEIELPVIPALGPCDLDPDVLPMLSALGRNLTAIAAAGKIDPVIGRDEELEQLLDVLARRRANNPLLVGPPGVGKTAIVEGLALRLAEGGEGVRGLEGRVVVEISAGALVSGTGVRGALADRMQRLRDEVLASEGRVLLFIDEIHAVVGGDGPDDLSSELKAALARGELPCIGATTDAEYRRCFERDAALARRFSVIRVVEPSPPDALRILQGIAPRYERHHGVAYEPAALSAAVEQSVRYLTERQLPDKAIGIIDQAAARVRRRGGSVVDVEAVAGVIAEQAAVPVERLLMRDADRLLELEQHLAERIVGHVGAIERIADVLRKGAAGFRGRRPLGTFLLLGPTGVGKTEMAKAVADVAFPTGALTRVDMSELGEAHAVARLLGAPPGYVGHEDGGQLTEAVRRRPYQLLLLDEVEKAHPEVLLSLLPLLDEGRLTDARGRTVDFTHTIIFMTSNLGSQTAAPLSRIGFGGEAAPNAGQGEAALAAARAALPPELWNRIDEPLYFDALSPAEVAEIARRMLRILGDTVAREKGLSLEVHDSAIDALVAAGGYDPSLGARPMRRIIGRLVEVPLATAILSGELGRGDVVVLRGEGVRVLVEAESRVDAAE